MNEATHADVLTAAARGDDDALGVLVRAYHARVYRFGLQVCRDGFDADDAVQEAFRKLATRPDVARDRGALSWLMSVVRNACMRMLRPFVRERRALGERVEDAEGVASEHLDPPLPAPTVVRRPLRSFRSFQFRPSVSPPRAPSRQFFYVTFARASSPQRALHNLSQ
jgi:RNA polymerase sigma factor (sigma-70 family)